MINPSIQKIAEEVNPVREHSSLTNKDGGFIPPSKGNDLYHRQESVAFSNGVKIFEVMIHQSTITPASYISALLWEHTI